MTTVLYHPEMRKKSRFGFLGPNCTTKKTRSRFLRLVTVGVLALMLGAGLRRLWVVEGYMLDPVKVEPVMQIPELPNGCEAASLASVLQYYGYSVDKLDLAYGYIPRMDFFEEGETRYGGNPEEYYPGDPATGVGFYCFAAPLAEGANGYLQQQNSFLHAYDITGVSPAGLREYLGQEIPVIVWITIDGEEPRYSNYAWTDVNTGESILGLANVHCVVLTALGESKCMLADPLDGEKVVEKDSFIKMFTAMGSRAVVIHD